MIRILYSYGIDDSPELFHDFLAAVRSDTLRFLPFDHRRRLAGRVYADAYRLDVDWRRREPLLMALYRDLERSLADSGAEMLAVDNDNVYHPEFLRSLDGVFKVLVSTDDPVSTYARTVPYLRAFDHVTIATPAYNERIDLRGFLLEAGARAVTFKPIGLTPYTYVPARSEDQLMTQERPVEVCYVGGYYSTKAEAFRKLVAHFGRRLVMHGFWGWRGHLKYARDTHGFRLVRRISYPEMVRLYQRARVGVNLAFTSQYALGNMRLFQLPANGVMQVSDNARSMPLLYEPGREVVTFERIEECIEQVERYLRDDAAREAIARAGHRRTLRDWRFETIWERFVAGLAPQLGAASAAPPTPTLRRTETS